MPRKRTIKTKGKKEKGKIKDTKGELWVLEGDKVVRTHKHCPKCGPGVYMADHYDRMHCGKCGYTMFKRSRRSSSN